MSLLDSSIDRGSREIVDSSVVVGGFSLILKLGVGFISYSGELIIGDDGRVPFPSHGSRPGRVKHYNQRFLFISTQSLCDSYRHLNILFLHSFISLFPFF